MDFLEANLCVCVPAPLLVFWCVCVGLFGEVGVGVGVGMGKETWRRHALFIRSNLA